MKIGEYVKKRIFQIKGSLSSKPSTVVLLGMIIYLKSIETKSHMTDEESKLLGSKKNVIVIIHFSLFTDFPLPVLILNQQR